MNVFRHELDLSPAQLLQEIHTEIEEDEGETVTYVEQYFDCELPDCIRVQVYRLIPFHDESASQETASPETTQESPPQEYFAVHLVGAVVMGRGVLH